MYLLIKKDFYHFDVRFLYVLCPFFVILFLHYCLVCIKSTSPLWWTCRVSPVFHFLHTMLQWISLTMCYFSHLQAYLWVNFYNWKSSCCWSDTDRNRKTGRKPFPLLSSFSLSRTSHWQKWTGIQSAWGLGNVCRAQASVSQSGAEWSQRRENVGK